MADTLEYKGISGKKKDVYYETHGFYVPPEEINDAQHGGVSLLMGHRVVKLDPIAHYAYLDDGRKIKYGKCLIATGWLNYSRLLHIFHRFFHILMCFICCICEVC